MEITSREETPIQKKSRDMSELSSQARIWLSEKESCFAVDVEKSFPPRKVFWNPYFVQEASRREREVEKVEIERPDPNRGIQKRRKFKRWHVARGRMCLQTRSCQWGLKASIPIGKIDMLWSLLEKNSYRLIGSSHLRQYVSMALKKEIERIKQELKMIGQVGMTRALSVIFYGSTR